MKTTFLAALAALVAMPAVAHVSFETREAEAGRSYKAVLTIPHGCDGEATQAVAVTLPEGIFDVKPMPKPGWTLETDSGDYARSYDNHGEPETSGVRRIVWTGELPDAHFDEFVFRGTLSGDLAPGTVLYFPVEQSCASGVESWSEIPVEGGERPAMPAPGLTIRAGEHAHHH
ncbi:DUF1775 domain-containing protein [Paracoccus sp. Z118]|uniref:YcnI family copper-binding membrane protein n=1 Tax=Paracoccus sp. Z118 TaxID=2851017 RepID=UPI001C2B800C|nr:DUF1775 domain-containing protein [Paracoccus sp. Z118]MBV0892909.1 DUF1775 domain-containing protein [Paracoccus sp. Z118]